MNLNIAGIAQCSRNDGLSTTEAFLKLAEEHGELAAAHLNKNDIPNKSKSSSPNTLEEAVDVLMCDLDYILKDGHTAEDIQAMIDKKCIKWRAKIEARFNQ